MRRVVPTTPAPDVRVCTCVEPSVEDENGDPIVCLSCLLPVSPDRRRCAACLRWLDFGQAKLMWARGGTYRLCKNERGCRTRTRLRIRDLEREILLDGKATTERTETIEALRKYVR